MAFNFGAFFSSGVKEIGEGFKAKDVSVKAEAKASAEAFAEAQESYDAESAEHKARYSRPEKYILP